MPKQKKARITMEMVDLEFPQKIHKEIHIQKLHSDEIILKYASPYFVCQGILDGFTTNPAHDETEEIYYILKKL